MKIFVMQVTLRAEWVHSLKEKRMVVQSLTQKLKHKFNVSVSEIAMQDVHKEVVIGIAGIGASQAQMDSITGKIDAFIEVNTDAEVQNVDIQFDQY